MRAIDEHTKLARASLDFDTDLDPLFNINVAKMRVRCLPSCEQMLERPVHELCLRADDGLPAEHAIAGRTVAAQTCRAGGAWPARADGGRPRSCAALQTGEYRRLERIGRRCASIAPDAQPRLWLR